VKILSATGPAEPRDASPNQLRRLGPVARIALGMAQALGRADALVWTSRVGERVRAEQVRGSVVAGRRVRPMAFRASLPTAPAAAAAIACDIRGPVEALDACATLALLRAELLLARCETVMVLGGDTAHDTVPLEHSGFGGLLLGRGDGLSLTRGQASPAAVPSYPTAGLATLVTAALGGRTATLCEPTGRPGWTVHLEPS